MRDQQSKKIQEQFYTPIKSTTITVSRNSWTFLDLTFPCYLLWSIFFWLQPFSATHCSSQPSTSHLFKAGISSFAVSLMEG
jgi:hypothetical protein